jgi:AraC-like DNA-binding protein
LRLAKIKLLPGDDNWTWQSISCASSVLVICGRSLDISGRFPGTEMRSNNRSIYRGTGSRRSSGGLETATVRIGGTAIPEVLGSLGFDAPRVLARFGIDWALYDDPDNVISLAALGRLLKYCAARARCPHLGLLIGQRAGLHTLGLVGLAARYAPDVETALRTLETHVHLHNAAVHLSVSADDCYAALSYDMLEPNVEAVSQLCDGALAGFCNALRTLCGPEWQPTEICLAHDAPADVRPYRRAFRAPLRFDAERYTIIFPVVWLRRPLPASDPALTRLLRHQLATLEAKYTHSFPEQVRAMLRGVLLSGNASAEHVASLFSMHSRTLRRRLAESETTFKALADEGRCALSKEMLANTALDVSQIAASLDYADSSAFTRAFRRWTGTTPAAWRAARSAASSARPPAARQKDAL